MSSQVIYTKMKEAVAFVAGWDRTTGNWSTDRDNLFEYLKKDALSRWEGAHPWSFLNIWTTLELTPTYTTGTIAIASGVVTLTSGTFPSWAAQGHLWVTDDSEMRRYSVNTLDNSPTNTQITLDDTGVDVTAGATYALRRHTYDLPSNFGGALVDGFAFRRDSIHAGRDIKQVGLSEFQKIDREVGALANIPCAFTLQPIAVTATASTAWHVMFTPLPNDTMFLDYRYKVAPADVDSTNDFPYGGPQHSETILASLRYSTALYFEKPNAEELRMEYMRKLQDSIRIDGHYRPIDYGPGRHGFYSGNGLRRHAYASIDDATLFAN